MSRLPRLSSALNRSHLTRHSLLRLVRMARASLGLLSLKDPEGVSGEPSSREQGSHDKGGLLLGSSSNLVDKRHQCRCTLLPILEQLQCILYAPKKKPFNSLAPRVALGSAAVATPISLPLPHFPPCGISPCALRRGPGRGGG